MTEAMLMRAAPMAGRSEPSSPAAPATDAPTIAQSIGKAPVRAILTPRSAGRKQREGEHGDGEGDAGGEHRDDEPFGDHQRRTACGADPERASERQLLRTLAHGGEVDVENAHHCDRQHQERDRGRHGVCSIDRLPERLARVDALDVIDRAVLVLERRLQADSLRALCCMTKARGERGRSRGEDQAGARQACFEVGVTTVRVDDRFT